MLKNTDAVIELETKMVEIYRTRDEANRVVGIRVATADGYKTIEARKDVYKRQVLGWADCGCARNARYQVYLCG